MEYQEISGFHCSGGPSHPLPGQRASPGGWDPHGAEPHRGAHGFLLGRRLELAPAAMSRLWSQATHDLATGRAHDATRMLILAFPVSGKMGGVLNFCVNKTSPIDIHGWYIPIQTKLLLGHLQTQICGFLWITFSFFAWSQLIYFITYNEHLRFLQCQARFALGRLATTNCTLQHIQTSSVLCAFLHNQVHVMMICILYACIFLFTYVCYIYI